MELFSFFVLGNESCYYQNSPATAEDARQAATSAPVLMA
jgi:hypothetical protein